MKGSFEKNNLKIISKKVDGFKSFVPMFHSHVEIVFVLKGKIKMCIDGFVKELSKDELSITFPYSIHSYDAAPEAQAIILMFSPETVNIYETELCSHNPTIPYLENTGNILYLLEKIIEYSNINEKLTNAYLTAAVGEIVQRLTLNKVEKMDFNSVQRILMYCAEHYKENISIKCVASSLYLSESYISKVFANKLGYSFREYINYLRISEAKRILKNTDSKIIDTMYSCGFNNQSSFNRIFIEETGMTPREYRILTKKSQ